jgi:hypothetical protein
MPKAASEVSREDAPQPRQPEPPQGVHGAAAHDAGVIPLAVVERDHDLAELGRHAQDAGDPQPEQGARAAERDRGRHAGNVAHAHGGGERGRHRLERGDAALAGAGPAELAEHLAERRAEPAELHAAGEDREEEASAHQQHQHRGTPDETVEPGVRLGEDVDHDMRLADSERKGRGTR